METLSRQIKELALKAGFQLVGISPARQPAKSKFLDDWIARRYHGNMNWMQTRQAVRKNIHLLFPEARSVICVAHNYYSSADRIVERSQANISGYAWGKDYHLVIKKRLKVLYDGIKELHPRIKGRLCVDSAPLMEKVWAEAAGLGWQGKHTILISRHVGSWFFLAEIIVDIELDYDHPAENHCGQCNACLAACPTGAIIKPYLLDASRCISYLTIEYKDRHLPVQLAARMANWIYGCDICQQVCPWNKFKKISTEHEYWPLKQWKSVSLSDWLNLKEDQFKEIFISSSLKRIGYKNFMRNIQNALENISDRRTSA
jgi:epoxyqueuosine reductase